MIEIGIVMSDGLNLRRKPGAEEKDVINKLDKGERLKVIERPAHVGKARWIRIEDLRTGQQGYVAEVDSHGTRLVRIENLPPDVPTRPPAPIRRGAENDNSLMWIIIGGVIGAVALIIIGVHFWG